MSFTEQQKVAYTQYLHLRACAAEAEVARLRAVLCSCKGTDDYCPCQNALAAPPQVEPAEGEAGLVNRLLDAMAKWRGTNADTLFAEAADALVSKDAYMDLQSAELLSLRRKVEETEAALEKQRDDEDKAAREMQAVIQGLRNMATAAERKVEELGEALVIANAQLADMEFLSVEGFMGWKQDRRALAGDRP